MKNRLQMKRFKVILLLLFIPVALQAQAIGQVPFGARVFSTGFPDTEKYWGDDGPMSSWMKMELSNPSICSRTIANIHC